VSQNRNRPVITGIAAVVAAGLLAGGLFLTARQGADDPTIDVGSAARTPSDASTATGDGTVTITRTGPDLPGSAALARCDSTTQAAVAQYETQALGRVTLQCGTAAQGYEHIRVRHTADWRDVVTGHGSRDWDDAMLTAVQTALEDGFESSAQGQRRLTGACSTAQRDDSMSPDACTTPAMPTAWARSSCSVSDRGSSPSRISRCAWLS